ncbi:MAG: right-handed parallel beta-helix repeat-containing protein [candidate division Zixibacteria bacterium]|nr:right-handed parallel beta-helix repeat-containing protein [candidate division Zixibacteria bacterium]
MTKYFTLILSLILSLVLINQTNATSWYVHPDSTLNTIQAGLDSASAGDTVLVAPGTYEETIIWPSTPGIDLISELGPDVTVIDANGAGRVITMAQYLVQQTVIDGFKIMNGWATGTSPDDYGGGIYCLNTSPTIRNNIIRDNSGYSRAGGIYCENSNPLIIGNIIRDNGTSGRGGGISCYNGANSSIRENYFCNNSGVNGGAIDCYISSHASIQHNQIDSNNAVSGGGIFVGYANAQSWPSIHYNNISGNVSWGIYCNNYSHSPHYPQLQAQDNWWGHPVGPDSGDGASGPIDYDPWLKEEIVFDIAVISIGAPPDFVHPGSTYTPQISVRNNCNYNYPISFFTAKCSIDGYQDYVRINQSIPQDSTMEVTFADWVAPSEYPVSYLMTVLLFYAVDHTAANDSISKEVQCNGIEDSEVLSWPSSFALFQNYPNPFNPTTQIEFLLSKSGHIKIEIFNTLGQKVSTVVDQYMETGHRLVEWDGKDDLGKEVASGIYFYRIKTPGFFQTKKMVLLR